MDSKDIPARLIELHSAIIDKIGRQTEPTSMVINPDSNAPFRSCIDYGRGSSHCKYIEGETPYDFFETAMSFVADLPSEAEQNLAEFQADLAKLIDKGRDYNIDLDFVNPLIDTSKRLAENAITHQDFTTDD